MRALLPLLLCSAGGVAAGVPAVMSDAAPADYLAGHRLLFERNDGQVAPAVRFLSRGQGYTLFLTPGEMVWSLGGTDERATVRMSFVGSNATSHIEGRGIQPEKRHYLTGKDRAGWHTNVPVYDEVVYHALYKGVDLVLHSARNVPEYDFVVTPGASPGLIQLQLDGAAAELDTRGNLLLRSAGRELVQHAPVVYQDIGGERRYIDGRFVLKAADRIGFEIASYDATYPLVIDPVISYATVYGGSGADVGRGIAVNATGIYITGETDSIDFPAQFGKYQQSTAGNKDVFVVKLNASGSTVEYATYLGGTGNDTGNGIAIDSSGNAFITGDTTSADFPTTNQAGIDNVCGTGSSCNGGLSDAFVAKLNATGTALVFSTYLGGSAADSGAAIAVDGSGNAYLAGETASGGLPTAAPFQATIGGGTDAFVTKYSGAGVLTYSTFLGGASDDSATGIAVDSAGNAYLAGVTFSSNFPKTVGVVQEAPAGAGDVFVTKLNSAGSGLGYSTYLGGASFDRGYAIAVDGSGNAYVAGATNSLDFPTVNPVQGTQGSGGITRDAFVTKLNAAGAALTYSTLLGGAGIDIGTAIAVNTSGSAFITGQTVAADFPLQNAAQGFLLGDSDAFVVNLSSSGALVYSTYLGGSGADVAFGIALDAANVAHVTGQTLRPDAAQAPNNQIADVYAGSDALKFPAVGAIQSSLRGSGDAFIAQIATTLSADLAVTKTDNATSTVIVGQPYTSTVTVINNGPNAANEVMLVDTYPVTFSEPLSLAVSAATPSQGSCSTAERVVVCELGVLASAASASVSLTYIPAEATPHTRTSFVARASESDPVATNNLASITTRVVTTGGGSGAVSLSWLCCVGLAGLLAAGHRSGAGSKRCKLRHASRNTDGFDT